MNRGIRKYYKVCRTWFGTFLFLNILWEYEYDIIEPLVF